MKRDKKKIVIVSSLIIMACIVAVFAFIKLPGLNMDLLPDAVNTFVAQDDVEEVPPITQLFDDGDYEGFIKAYDALEEPDETLAPKRDEALSNMSVDAIDKAWELIYQYDYAGAKEELDKVLILGDVDSEEFKKLYETCEEYSVTVPFEGAVEHIFYHPLIAYPEEAFDGDSQSKGFDDYFVTVQEFKDITQRMYENDFIFIDIRLIYEEDENGQISKSEILLPEGKKPVVLSIDDLNFYKYMKGNGMAHGFELDENNVIRTYTDMEDGTRTTSYDNAIVPILEEMMKTHPDLFWGGHKGTIALTGYEGALGFPTDIMDAPDYDEVLAEAKGIADKLKVTGWNFACHSYGHNSPSRRTLEQMTADTDKWLKEVVPVVGETDLYIYPFGELIDFDDQKHLQMVEKGFNMFCGVESKQYMRFYDEWVLQQRRNIDGIAFYNNRLDELFETDDLIDTVRPERS